MPQVDEKKIGEMMQKSIDTSVKIRELRLEMAKLNQELLRAGARVHDLAAW